MIHNRIFELKNMFKNVAGDKQSTLKPNRVTTASLGNTIFLSTRLQYPLLSLMLLFLSFDRKLKVPDCLLNHLQS